MALGARDGALIRTQDLRKEFEEMVALDDVDLSVEPGTILGLIGPSGCGKTTLVRTLIGITRPTSGHVEVFGQDPTHFTIDTRQRFGYMPQQPVLFPNLTVWGNLTFMSSVYGLPVRRRRQHLMRLLDLVDLVPHRHKRLAELSGGMQRRLTLAATLVHDPELLFLDEPTAGVDPILREKFWAHFRTLRDQGKTVVVPTQYVSEAVSCDLVAVMAKGHLITVVPPEMLAREAYGGTPLAVPLQQAYVSREEVERIRSLPYVCSVRRSDDGLTVVVGDPVRDQPMLATHLAEAGISVGEIEPFEPSYDEMFVAIVERDASSRGESTGGGATRMTPASAA
jgi:ABC-2 type transport system ATP-binding protein